MTDTGDTFPGLPLTVDLGGMLYYLGTEKPVELAYRSRKEFQNIVNTLSQNNSLRDLGQDEVERLLRRYMYADIKGKKRLKFGSADDKANLLRVLKARARQLKETQEFSSSLLKNTEFQRSYLHLQQLIADLEGQPLAENSLNSQMAPKENCAEEKKFIKQIPDNKKYQLILEMAWFLLHPDKVPKDVECDWARLVEKLDTMRLGELVIPPTSSNNTSQGQTPLNYFQKIDLPAVLEKPTIKNALDEAKQMAREIQGQSAQNQMKERCKTLLNVLVAKKYLETPDTPINKGKLDSMIIQNPSSPIQSAQKGGGSSTLDKPLGLAMNPLFVYFKQVYDPIYSFLEPITKLGGADMKTVMLPQLLTILHICNNLNPASEETATSGLNTDGVYRITNVSQEILDFFGRMIGATKTHVDGFTGEKADELKRTFNKQVFALPKVRLSSVLTFGKNTGYKDPAEIPYLQFYMVGQNLELEEKQAFLNKEKRTVDMFEALNKFFIPSDLYIVCSKSANMEDVPKNVPMNLYQIDYNSVDVDETSLKIDRLLQNYFNKMDTQEKDNFHLDDLVKLEPYIAYNDAELALSIFIAFKQLLPK